jgi:hypothetical protein
MRDAAMWEAGLLKAAVNSTDSILGNSVWFDDGQSAFYSHYCVLRKTGLKMGGMPKSGAAL